MGDFNFTGNRGVECPGCGTRMSEAKLERSSPVGGGTDLRCPYCSSVVKREGGH